MNKKSQYYNKIHYINIKKYESATFKTPMTASARLGWSSGLMFIYCLLIRNIAYVSSIKQISTRIYKVTHNYVSPNCEH